MKDIEEVTLIATGDIMLGGTLDKVFREKGFESLINPLVPDFNKADIVFGNLEAPFSNQGNPQKNKILLYQESKVINYLKYLGYDVLSLGNNHIMDYAEEGLKETIKILEKSGIRNIGAGSNAEEARKPAGFSIKGIKISFLGYTSATTDKSNPLIYAQEKGCGLVPLDLKIIEEDIDKVRSSGADIVIISLHWGEDRYHFPAPEQLKIAHAVIELGADIILGHHSHILQGIEKYQKGLIVYSLGNFLFGEFVLPDGRMERWSSRNRLTAYLQCRIKKAGIIDYRIVPLLIGKDLIPHLPGERKKRKAFARIGRYSEVLSNPGYEKSWRKIVLKEEINIILEKIKGKLLRQAN